MGSAHASPDLLLRRKAQVLHAALVNHPERIAENAEELAEFTLFQQKLGSFCGLLVDLIARVPDFDTAGPKCHLGDQGYAGILGEILSPARRGSGACQDTRRSNRRSSKRLRRPRRRVGIWPRT